MSDRQSVQYPANVKLEGDDAIKFPGNLGIVKAKIHRDLPIGKIETVTVSKTNDDRFFPSSHLCSNMLLPIQKMDLSVCSFDCPHCGQRHDRDVNAAINIKNEGLRILALGISATANRGSVNPHGSGRKKSMNSKVAPIEIGSPRSICTQMSVG